MKKITAVLLSAAMLIMIIAFPMTMSGCTRDPRHIRLSEVTRSVFYAPMYVALHHGFFKEAGITVELTNAGGADRVMAALVSGSADIGLKGPEATVYTHVEGMRNHPMVFGQLTFRDGSFLMGRAPIENFEWSDLAGSHILGGRRGGMPAMTLQYVIENSGGLSLDQLNFDTSVDFNLMVGAFEGDTRFDFVTAFEPVASDMIRRGTAYRIASVGYSSGILPATTFSAHQSFINDNPDVIYDFLAAIRRGLEFILANDALDVAKIISPSFPGTDIELLAASVESYLSIGTWSLSPVMEESGFDKLQDIMINAGHLRTRANFSDIVDNSIAKKLVS